MAVLLVEGFEISDTIADYTSGSSRWGSSANAAPNNTVARTGAFSCRIINGINGNLISRTLSPSTTTQGVCGFAFQFSALPGSTVTFFQVREGTTVHITLGISATGTLVVGRNGTALAGGTSTSTLSINTWYYIEIKWTISDTVGTFDVQVDESTTGWPSGSGVDTRNSGTGIWNTVAFGIGNQGGSRYFDDIYVADGSSFIGNCKVDFMLAQADSVAAGSNAQWTPSTGSDHGALVDDSVPDDDTGYVSDSVVGDRDSYTTAGMSLSGAVKAVQVSAWMEKTDAGVRTVKEFLRINGSNYDHGTAISPATTYQYQQSIWDTSPDTGVAFTPTEVNSAEIGVKIES